MKNSFELDALSIIKEGIEKPGLLSQCFSVFHNYSVLNGIALTMQCRKRGLPVGPVASFKVWKDRGGCVRKGEKALFVNIPYTVTLKTKPLTLTDDAEQDENEPRKITLFAWKPCVFTLAQVDIDTVENIKPARIKWSFDKMLDTLDIPVVPFESINGNLQGYTTSKGIAINPVAEDRTMTALHEIAHYLMHLKSKDAPEVREVEAELCAYVVGQSLDIMTARQVANSRGYIQDWLKNGKLSNKSALKILATANKILKAGE